MTDRFERAVQKIAARTNGGPKTSDDVFDVVCALADDTDEQHSESTKTLKELGGKVDATTAALTEHIEVYAKERDRRIKALENAQVACPAVVDAAIRAEHEVRHNDHMRTDHAPRRSDDEAGEDHAQERRSAVVDAGMAFKVKFMWGGLAVLGISICNALAYWLVYLFTVHH